MFQNLLVYLLTQLEIPFLWQGGGGSCYSTCTSTPPSGPSNPSGGSTGGGGGDETSASAVYGPPAPTVDQLQLQLGLESTKILHPLSGNVVSQIPIYDYSHYPPTIIGNTITSYAYDDAHIDTWGFLRSFVPSFSDPIAATSTT